MKVYICVVSMFFFLGCNSDSENSAPDCSMQGNECSDGFLCMMDVWGSYECMPSTDPAGANPQAGTQSPTGGADTAGTHEGGAHDGGADTAGTHEGGAHDGGADTADTHEGGADEGGTEGGADEGGAEGATSGSEGGSGAEEASITTAIESGRFWLGLALILDPANPIAFVTEIEFEIAEDGSMGRVLSMYLDPMTCEDRSISAEGVIDFTEGVELNSDSSFEVDLGERTIPGAANCISGSLILANIVMHGTIVSNNAICGTVTGELFHPFAFALEDSTFAAVRLEEGTSTRDLAIPSTCDEIEALGADQ
jgi:hypothetical protein